MRTPGKSPFLYMSLFDEGQDPISEKYVFGFHQTMKCKYWGFVFTLHKCVCWERLNHISSFQTSHETQMRYAHRGMSDICILSSQSLSEFIHISDGNRFATAELERHY